ncbi:GNAT family N-acetyltransferase [Fusibacter ferrireducens]|uniref:GNAT family N-acetyltransferase n=1 Tax=Fusibacter ferrireducens TaxID=2785058 RepID=A0ABR9ZVN2_9FIRM|nr:GNAT family protein [Fusibacter ferrireducens]MBF4694493.1 GNAT family N-acetyltransferase [Fusibacter ferrireducens]
MKLENERIRIREYRESDFRSLHLLLTNNKVMTYMPEIRSNSLDDSYKTLYDAILESKLIHRQKYFFALEEKATNTYIGEIGYTILLEAIEGNVVNLGYFILPQYWGMGYVTEAVKMIIDYMFETQNIVKICAGCVADNRASIRVMEKAGMVQESHLVKHMILEGNLHDRYDYRITKDEWQVRVSKSKR